MLKHEENSVVSSPPAAQVRVTPEELATALSRIEAKKDAGQRHVDGTIPIGEAMQQLGVDTTPEEVLAEVQAIRQEPRKAEKRRPSSRQRLALLSGAGLGLIGLVGWWSVPHAAENQTPSSVAVTLPTPQAAPKPISLDPNLLVYTASHKLVMLSEVGDSQPVECLYSEGSFHPFDINDPRPSWTLIRHGSLMYVQGWLPHMSSQALQRDGIDVSTWSQPENIPVTLPLNSFQVVPDSIDTAKFHAVNLHLDKYAYEKWSP